MLVNRKNVVARSAAMVVVGLMSWLSMTSAGAVTIDWVTVGDSGNVNDPRTYTNAGAVAYDYRIMKFEFTNSQYTAFLNAIDPSGTNPNGVYTSSMGSDARGGISFTSGNAAGRKYAVRSNMGDKPVNFVSWWDAARVSNWLHNGARTYASTDSSATAPQNTGAYTVGTTTLGPAVTVNPGAQVYVPTDSEWYKAAFYDPTLNGGAGGYRVYGNGFDTTPGIVSADAYGVGSAGGTGNFANYNWGADWNGQDGNVTTVGTNGGASYYGAFDMSGNILEWTDSDDVNGALTRRQRGGYWYFGDENLQSGYAAQSSPSAEADIFGFRLASPVAVPEPSTWVMAGAGLAWAGWGAWRRRRCSERR
jgi:sulfatase modifying factor 1